MGIHTLTHRCAHSRLRTAAPPHACTPTAARRHTQPTAQRGCTRVHGAACTEPPAQPRCTHTSGHTEHSVTMHTRTHSDYPELRPLPLRSHAPHGPLPVPTQPPRVPTHTSHRPTPGSPHPTWVGTAWTLPRPRRSCPPARSSPVPMVPMVRVPRVQRWGGQRAPTRSTAARRCGEETPRAGEGSGRQRVN